MRIKHSQNLTEDSIKMPIKKMNKTHTGKLRECLDPYCSEEKEYGEKMNLILGAIAGDIIGSEREFQDPPCKTTDFELFQDGSNFTDDSILTIATMDVLNRGMGNYAETYKKFGNKYPSSYGESFFEWLASDSLEPYNSYGNGSGMRVSPIGWAYNTIEETLAEAKKSAECTHSHPEGIKGAQAIAAAVYLARTGSTKEQIKKYVENTFKYNLDFTCDEIRPNYDFDTTCQGSVPESIVAFLESSDYESAVRLAVSLGGDTDTQAAMAGAIAEAYYKEIPEYITSKVIDMLTGEQLKIIQKFSKTAELCLEAVKQDGYALKFVPEELKEKVKNLAEG
jgi:ADP-ribosylglycohydrolase